MTTATQFGAGNNANPRGAPKTATLSKAYRNQMEMICPQDREGRTWAQVIAHTLVVRAFKGNVQAAAELADRCEGKARQSLSVSREPEERSDEIYDIIRRISARNPEPDTSGRESGNGAPADGDNSQG